VGEGIEILAELKRRNVIRVAGLYGVVGWLLAQAASLLESTLALPAWFDAVVVSLLLIGLPLALVFSWAFEITPEGLKRTAEVPEGASIAPKTGRKLDVALIGAVVALIAVIAADRFIGPAAPGGTADITANVSASPGADATETDNSIAVLPFADMSSEKDQEYFSDGISEELLNVLAQVQGLRVAGRTSSFAFKGQNKDLREIGEILNVGHIVEGSIRKAGNKVRITAQLIKATDGYHQWSNTYDRDLTDIFAVQDEIAGAIVQEMSAALPALAQASAGMKPVARADIGAYDAFLLAREKMTQVGSRAAYEEAVELLDGAIAEDPHYAPALAWRSYAGVMLSDVPGGVGDTPMAEALPVIKEYADRALAEDPASPEAVFALGSYYGQLTWSEGVHHLDKTIETLRQAVALRPNFPQAQNDLAYFIDSDGGKAEALEIVKDVLANDPGLRDANVTYLAGLVQIGRYEDAEAALARWARIRPDIPEIKLWRGRLLAEQGRLAEAWRASEEIEESGEADKNLAFMQFIVRWKLHDGEWIIENAANQRWQAAGAILEGDAQRAVELIDGDPVARQNGGTALATYIPAHYSAGDAKAVIAWYEAEMKTPAGAIDAWNFCGCSPLHLVLALQDAGHPDFEPLLAAWKRKMEAQSEIYARSAFWNGDRADIAALEGDFTAAKKFYGLAIDAGWRNPNFISRDLRKFLPQDPEFDALLSRMVGLVNTERRSLGMPPLDAA
jgi:TolB-like protein/Tfp pilus assembly protein PilF